MTEADRNRKKKSLTGTQLGLFDAPVVRDAKKRQITDWPDRYRFPLNFAGRKVEDVVCDDISRSTHPLLVTGFTSLDYLIDFVADLPDESPERISLLLGSEPSPARRTDYGLSGQTYPQEVLDYWLEAGISLRLCHKILLFIEMLEKGRISSRYISDRDNTLHAKIFIADVSATLGSSNFSFTGFRKQLEANVRFDAQKEPKRYREVKQIAENYWSLGEDYTKELLDLLRQLLQVVSWQEALGRACAELLEGDWARQYLKNSTVSNGNELWPSQKVGIAQALWMVENVGSVLVADATGSGKTRMGAHLLRAVMDKIWSTGRARKDITVLVCPPNTVEDSWQRESGACGLPLITMSHGILSHKKSGKHEDTLNLVRRAQSLAIDEAHNFLNPKSSRTRGILGNMADVMVMFTATPINRGVRDLLRIVDLLGADNLEESALKLFERLEKRSRKAGNQFVTTKEERLAMQKEVQRFTLRRTKSMLNTMVDQEPERYCDDRGTPCRYPEHIPQTYPTRESGKDQECAEKIRKLAGKLLGLVNLRSGIDLPDGLPETINREKYIRGRLLGAKGLAVYNVMSRLRSSKAALVEHLLGTQAALEQFGLHEPIKTEDTGNILQALEENSGRIPESSLQDLLPDWLVDPEKHQKYVQQEVEIYHRILTLVSRISDNRERAKADRLAELTRNHPLILAFDSCLITLAVIQKYLQQHDEKFTVLVATGSQTANKKKVNDLFQLGSSAKGVIALCSDAMSEGLNLQQASTVVLLDMPSVIRLAEQRVGRVDRMNSPHKQIEVWWPLDTDAFSLKTDKKFFRRYSEVKDILGSNLDLPDNLVPEEMVDGPATVEEMVQKLKELDKKGTSWDGIHDAFQPVRDLVDDAKGIVPEDVYGDVKESTARVVSSVSLVKAQQAWAFFAIAGVNKGAPKWVFLEHAAAKPITHLEEVAELLRKHLAGEPENQPMNKEASMLIEKFLQHVLARESELLPRKKQRALYEMDLVLKYWHKKAKEEEQWQRKELLEQILDLVNAPRTDQDRPDLDSIAEAWLDLTRDVWYETLLKRRRFKPLRLKDIRKNLQKNPLATDRLQQTFSNIVRAPSLYARVVAAIIGVA
ncbi:MAG: helicase [Desulfobulbus sp.]|nr:MAG: helicase [Desulfobulbus sp.]